MSDFKWRPRGLIASPLLQQIPVKTPEAAAVRSALVENMERRKQAADKQRFAPSPQQQAYFDWIQNGSGNALLQAVAGAGKTTTLIRGFPFMQGTIFCGAFNKSAALDMKNKADRANVQRSGLHISTVHASGLYDWRRIHKTVEIDDNKVRKLIEEFAERTPALMAHVRTCRGFIGKMVSFGKQFLIGCAGKPEIANMAVWLKLMDHFSVDQDLPESLQPEAALEWVMEVYRASYEKCPTRIDFDDMVYAPIAHNVRLFPNDWVLIDECQDINPARRELAKRLLKRGGRAVFIGDERQAIYGFTGAGGDSISKIKSEFNCQELPLTVTYRCPKAVVNYVHQWVSHIEAHPDAPEGLVRSVQYEGERKCIVCNEVGMREESDGRFTTCDCCAGHKRIPAKPWYFQDIPAIEDVILCRYTRPLIQTAYSMIKNGVACKVEGREIGRGLIALCRMWKITSIARLDERLTTWLAREVAKAQKENSEKRQQEAEDKVETIRVFMQRCKELNKLTIDHLVSEIEAMFDDNVKDVLTLCTGHKSKGREWPRVYWIQTAQRGRPSKEWEFVEETNVKYVMGTRAMRELILVPEGVL